MKVSVGAIATGNAARHPMTAGPRPTPTRACSGLARVDAKRASSTSRCRWSSAPSTSPAEAEASRRWAAWTRGHSISVRPRSASAPTSIRSKARCGRSARAARRPQPRNPLDGVVLYLDGRAQRPGERAIRSPCPPARHAAAHLRRSRLGPAHRPHRRRSGRSSPAAPTSRRRRRRRVRAPQVSPLRDRVTPTAPGT